MDRCRMSRAVVEEHKAHLSFVCGAFFFFQAEDGIRDLVRSRGLGDVYKRQVYQCPVPVRQDDDRESLKARIQRAEYKAYPRAIRMFIEGNPRFEGRRIVWQKERLRE